MKQIKKLVSGFGYRLHEANAENLIQRKSNKNEMTSETEAFFGALLSEREQYSACYKRNKITQKFAKKSSPTLRNQILVQCQSCTNLKIQNAVFFLG